MRVWLVAALVVLTSLLAIAPTAAMGQTEPNRISGTPGNDVIRGTPGRDVIRSLGGNDVVYGGGGNDVIDAGRGRDIVRGRSGDDYIEGGGGRDILYGGAGSDALRGEGNGDILHTRDGVGANDSANGGGGPDICHGDRGDRLWSCASSSPSTGGDDDGGSAPGGGGTGPGGEDVASGTCHMTGRITFTDPVGFAPEFTTFTDFAEGTCTGTVNGRFMANERTFLRAAGGGLLSCSANRVTDPGVMTFTRNTATRSDDVEIDYIAHSQGVFGQTVSRIRGRVSGESLGSVRFRGDEQSLRDCGAGRFRGGVYDTDGRTITPLVG